MKFPQINPIRFRVKGWFDDFETKQITVDQYAIGATVYTGVHPINYVPKFPRYTAVPFQVTTNVDIGDMSASLVDSDGNKTTILLTDITPTTWSGDSIYKGNIYVTSDGSYSVEIVDDIYEETAYSDTFQIGSLNNDDIEIKYYNSENDFNTIFYDGTSLNFQSSVYLQGQMIDVDLSQDISSYETDRGEIQKLRSTPVVNYDLKLYNINIAYSKMVNLIFSCDNLEINGIEFDNSEAPSVERIEDSDLCNITVKVRQKNYDYFYDQ